MDVNFCYQTASVWKVVGYFVLIFKIVVPLIIIVLGSIDFGRAVVEKDDKAMQNAGKRLFSRIIAGVCIFFIPTIINIAFGLVDLFNSNMEKDYKNCLNCLTSPTKNCDTSYKGNIFKK